MDTLCVGVSVRLPSGRQLGFKSCSELQQAFKVIRDSHWHPPKGYKLLEVGIELRSPTLPCLDADEAYIVSPISSPSGISNGQKCDQSRYVDTMVPSIVVPKCWSNSYPDDPKHKKECAKNPDAGLVPGVEVGDLVTLRGRTSGNFWYAIIGDLGPNAKLGKASVGLLMEADGRVAPPTYLRATNSLDRREQSDVVVFKNTRYNKPLTLANATDMANVAKEAFQRWGQGNLSDAMQRLAACGRIASPR